MVDCKCILPQYSNNYSLISFQHILFIYLTISYGHNIIIEILSYEYNIMARYSQVHKQNSHEKILSTASILFKKKGYEGTGLKEVMEDSGLTVGTFYAHFSSKAELLTRTFIHAWENSKARLIQGLEDKSKEDWLKSVVKRYLSRKHVVNIETGCPFPTLISELSRAPEETRKEIEDYFFNSIKRASDKMPGTPDFGAQERLLATFCLMVGAVSLSRAMASEEASSKILESAKKLALFGIKEN